MRKTLRSVLPLLALLLSITTAQAQLFEDFEEGSKTGYAGASVTLSTGDWYLDDALIGNLDNDKYNGSFGVRMDRRDGKTGNIYMEFDKPNGADVVSFYLAHYGNRAEDAALQVQYSTDGGSNWTDIGDEIAAPEELTQYSIPVEIDGNIRFKFVQSAGTDRMNIDDIRITDYIEAQENATIALTVDGAGVEDNESLTFASTQVNSERTQTVEVKNIGNQELTITTVSIGEGAFSISALTDSTLAFNETGEFEITFAPQAAGQFQATLEITSNAANAGTFTLNFSGEGLAAGEVIPISQARELPFGTRVTVGGRVTVANEFDGPSHIQDQTGAIAVYYPAFHTAVEHGDSVVVTGPLTEFNPIGGTEGDFLTQIAETDDDDNVSFEVIDTENEEVIPEVITIEQMNSGSYEAQLVVIQNVTIDAQTFQGEENYDISDASGSGLIRIDGDVSSLVGASVPSEPVNIIGVVDQFNGDYQLKPRSAEDVGVEEITYPGDDISKEKTFEIVTWNIEWFGSGSNGPSDLDAQFNNVKTVIDSLDADVYAFQEISNTSLFADLVADLDAYGGIIADFTQSQRTAYLFKRATVDSLDSGQITTGMTQSNWANGRFPLFFHFNATIEGESREIYSYNIHAKAFDDAGSYDQRESASGELKLYLDNQRADANVIFLGDYNDQVTSSITSGEPSPYDNFVDDEEYSVLTQSLEERGLASQSAGSFIDHITITSELTDEFIANTQRVENTSYIGSYLSSTSDHYPIWTRFQFTTVVSNEDESNDQPLGFTLEQNYPNPFNPTTNIQYSLAENSTVSLKVYDMLGREVATLVNSERMASGAHTATFDASDLSSGMYIYQLSTGTGQQLSRKMMLIK